jgi:hypothetical protein
MFSLDPLADFQPIDFYTHTVSISIQIQYPTLADSGCVLCKL